MVSTGPAPVPVPPEERIGALDLLRGFALFGVLWSNLNDWYGTTAPATRLDNILAFMQQWVIESRFYTLLGFVFGIGFAIQLARAESRGGDVRPVFYRRMLALFVFGVAHVVLLWRGDILVQYALLGCVLVLFRDLKPKGLVFAAFGTFLLVPYVIMLLIRTFHLRMVPFSPDGVDNWIYSYGAYGQVVAVRIKGYLDWYGRWPATVFPRFLTLFLLGLWTVRSGMLERLQRPWRGWRRAILIAIATVIVSVGISFVLQRWWQAPDNPPGDPRTWAFWNPFRVFLSGAFELFTWSSAAVYGLLLVRAAQTRLGTGILAPLIAVGRMPLTTYLTQSVVCSLLFYGYGLGWYGKVGYSGMLIVTCTLFAAQSLFSRWWLDRYRFGPAEWLWRSLAYGRLQPMSITPSRAALTEPSPLLR